MFTLTILFTIIQTKTLVETQKQTQEQIESLGSKFILPSEVKGLQEQIDTLQRQWEDTQAVVNNFDGMFKQFFEGD
jgi:peptidoglycan hydrolase CwlO-like protein